MPKNRGENSKTGAQKVETNVNKTNSESSLTSKKELENSNPQSLQEIRDKLADMPLDALHEYLCKRYRKCSRKQEILRTLLQSVKDEEKTFYDQFVACNNLKHEITRHGGDLTKVIRRRNLKVAENVQKLGDVLTSANDPWQFLHEQELTSYFSRLTSQHLSMNGVVHLHFSRVTLGNKESREVS